MSKSRDFVDVKVTETDIISLGFSITGVEGFGSSYTYILEEGDKDVVVQLWNSTSAYKYSLYVGVWPSDSKRLDTNTVRTYEDVRSLINLAQEIMKNHERYT